MEPDERCSALALGEGAAFPNERSAEATGNNNSEDAADNMDLSKKINSLADDASPASSQPESPTVYVKQNSGRLPENTIYVKQTSGLTDNVKEVSELSENEMQTSSSSASGPSEKQIYVNQTSGLFDDFKKCIEGFGETSGTNGYAAVYDKVEELKRNAKAVRGADIPVNGKKHGQQTFLQDVTRYNILDGTIMHCHEQTSYTQGAAGRQGETEQASKLATAAVSSQNEGPFLRLLLQKKNGGNGGDGETSSVGSPSQAVDAENQDKCYPCKACKKQYASKSSLRKHFCHPSGDAASLPSTAEMQKAPGIKIKQEIPEGQIPNGVVPSQPMPTFFIKSENGGPPLMASQFLLPNALPPGAIIPGATVPGATPNGENGEVKGEEIFSCPVCAMTFQHSSHLMRHRRTHTNERPFECTDCHQAFRRKCHLKRHWQRIHSGEKPFKCAICGKAFSDRDHQRQHETIHGPETYPCFRCRSVFPTENYLLNHLADNPECKAALARDGDASPRRMRGKHKGSPTAYKCGLCGELFKKLRQIQTHQRVRHHDVFEKKYKCNLCGKGFDLISDLTHHRNNHAVRSKLDVDKNGDMAHPTGFRGAPAHHAPPTPGGINPTNAKGVQNKAQLLDMLQQLEKRIQQQQKQVKKMESQQEQMNQELIEEDGSLTNGSMARQQQQPNGQPQMNGTEIRYMLDTRYPEVSRNLALGVLRNGRKTEMEQEGSPPLKRSRPDPTEAEAIDLSTKSSPPIRELSPDNVPVITSRAPVLSGADISVTVQAHMAKENFDQSQAKAIVNLMSDNRHKCEQCGLSFLLYSEFRAHRKRHERARAAMCKEDHSEHTSEFLAGNPDADRSMCRDCCSQDAPGVSPHTSPGGHGDGSAAPNGEKTNTDGKEVSGDHQKHCARGHRNRLCESNQDANARPRPCDGCMLLSEQLTKEREEKETLRQEIDRLREALVSYAEAAASRESPLRGSTELTAMFNRLTSVRSMEEALVASVK